MKSSLPSGRHVLRIFLISLLFTGFSVDKLAARTLYAGDLAIIGVNVLTDEMRFVTLVNLPTGTVIKITDKGWDQDFGMFTTTSTGDGVVTWTVASPIPAGTVFRLVLGGSDNLPANGLYNVTANTNITANASFSSFTVTDAMTTAGEQFFIYQDNEFNPYFITGLNAGRITNMDATNWQMIITATLVESMIPDGFGSQNYLTNGTNAMGLRIGGLQWDNVQYTGPITGTNRAGWLARLVNASNWMGDNTGTITGTIGTSAGTIISLPIKLSNFSAELQGSNTVNISWKIAQAEEGAVYDLQRGTDGKNFTSIHVQAGLAYKTDFSYSDIPGSSGNYYYRLKMRDIDGAITYSNIAIVKMGTKERAISIYPNPVNRGGSLQISLHNQQANRFELINQVGQMVHSQAININGSSSIVLPASLVPGIYTVRILSTDKVIGLKQVEVR